MWLTSDQTKLSCHIEGTCLRVYSFVMFVLRNSIRCVGCFSAHSVNYSTRILSRLGSFNRSFCLAFSFGSTSSSGLIVPVLSQFWGTSRGNSKASSFSYAEVSVQKAITWTKHGKWVRAKGVDSCFSPLSGRFVRRITLKENATQDELLQAFEIFKQLIYRDERVSYKDVLSLIHNMIGSFDWDYYMCVCFVLSLTH